MADLVSSCCCLVLLSPDLAYHQEAVQEVGADDIRDERGLAFLVNQCHDVIPNVSLPL